MDWALVFLHHFRAWAWWFLPFVVAFVVLTFVGADYVSFLRQRQQRARAVDELFRLGFGQVYQSDNVHTAAALLGDTSAQESIAESHGGETDDITYGELRLTRNTPERPTQRPKHVCRSLGQPPRVVHPEHQG